jgi:hypothetical protein
MVVHSKYSDFVAHATVCMLDVTRHYAIPMGNFVHMMVFSKDMEMRRETLCPECVNNIERLIQIWRTDTGNALPVDNEDE